MKQNIPEKGAVVQRDGETYAIKVHMPGGYTNPAELRRVADVAERHGIPEIKITIAQRIGLFGIPEERLDAVRADLGDLGEGGTGLCIRYVKMCPGASWCKRAQQVTRDVGMEMDRRYHRLIGHDGRRRRLAAAVQGHRVLGQRRAALPGDRVGVGAGEALGIAAALDHRVAPGHLGLHRQHVLLGG